MAFTLGFSIFFIINFKNCTLFCLEFSSDKNFALQFLNLPNFSPYFSEFFKKNFDLSFLNFPKKKAVDTIFLICQNF